MKYLLSKPPGGGSRDVETGETIGWRPSTRGAGTRRQELLVTESTADLENSAAARPAEGKTLGVRDRSLKVAAPCVASFRAMTVREWSCRAAGKSQTSLQLRQLIPFILPFILLAPRALAQCSGYGKSATVAWGAAPPNFVYYVNGTYGALTTANGVQSSSGYDICWSDTGNTISYTQKIISYNGSTGTLYFLVKNPNASTGGTTNGKVWWGKVGQSDPSANPFPATTKAVYLWQEASHVYVDATGNGNNSTSTTSDPTRVTGPWTTGYGASFNGTSQYVIFPVLPSAASAGSFSQRAWVNVGSATGSNMAIFDTRDTSNNPNNCTHGDVMYLDNTALPACYHAGNAKNVSSAGGSISRSAWHHLACDGNGTTMWLTVDGVAQGSGGITTDNAHGPTVIGADCEVGQLSKFAGQIAVLVVDSASQNNSSVSTWTTAEKANWTNPATFVTVLGAAPTISSFAASPGTITTGGYSTLSWSVSGATSIGISPGGYTNTSLTGSLGVYPTSTTTYTLTAYGSSNSTATATITVNAPAAPSFTTGPTATGNSPSSLLVSGSLNVSSSIKVNCGTAHGGPYTHATTPTLYGWSTNQTLSSWWGVTSFSVAVTGLGSPSTAYYCLVVATNASGISTTSAEVTASTNAALVSTPVAVTNVSPLTRINDQANGRNGFVANGFWFDGDTEYSTWADDGNTYGICNDCSGTNGQYHNANAWLKWSANHLSATNLPVGHEQLAYGIEDQRNIPASYSDGNRWFLEGALSVRGVIYTPETRGPTFCCMSFVKSNDHFATSIAPEHNTGPGATGVIGGDPPSSGNAQYMNPAVNPWPVQHCQDHSINCVWVGGADGYTYWLVETIISGLNRYIMRCRIENMPQQNQNPCEFYNGTQTGDDGLYDSNWVSSPASAHPVWAVATYGQKPQIAFLPDFNRYVATSWGFAPANQYQAAVGLVWDVGPYVWSLPSLIKTITRNLWVDTTYAPNFPQVLLASYNKASSNPLIARVTVTSTGSYLTRLGSPDTNDYGPYLHQLTLVARSATPARQPLSSNGRNRHLSGGMDLFYNFSDCSWQASIPDLSPNGLLLSHKYDANTSAALPLCDGNGMFSFGFPYDGFAGGNGVHYQTYTLTTPYTRALGGFTMFLAFSHYPSAMPVANECVLDKSDIQVCRNGTTANSWTVKVGTTTLGPFLLTTDGTFAGLVIRWDGTNIAVYGSAGIQASLPLTTLATGSYTGSLGTSAVTLGSLAAGTQPFYGTLSEFLVYSRALTDVELLREAGAFRRDMAGRGASIP